MIGHPPLHLGNLNTCQKPFKSYFQGIQSIMAEKQSGGALLMEVGACRGSSSHCCGLGIRENSQQPEVI